MIFKVDDFLMYAHAQNNINKIPLKAAISKYSEEEIRFKAYKSF